MTTAANLHCQGIRLPRGKKKIPVKYYVDVKSFSCAFIQPPSHTVVDLVQDNFKSVASFPEMWLGILKPLKLPHRLVLAVYFRLF